MNTVDITVQPNHKITKITAHLKRAENSLVTLASNRRGAWFDDGSTPVLENQATVVYAPRHPDLFEPSHTPYQIRIGGKFSTSNAGVVIDWVKIDKFEYPDYAEIDLYAGNAEPVNTVVTIAFQKV